MRFYIQWLKLEYFKLVLLVFLLDVLVLTLLPFHRDPIRPSILLTTVLELASLYSPHPLFPFYRQSTFDAQQPVAYKFHYFFENNNARLTFIKILSISALDAFGPRAFRRSRRLTLNCSLTQGVVTASWIKRSETLNSVWTYSYCSFEFCVNAFSRVVFGFFESLFGIKSAQIFVFYPGNRVVAVEKYRMPKF